MFAFLLELPAITQTALSFEQVFVPVYFLLVLFLFGVQVDTRPATGQLSRHVTFTVPAVFTVSSAVRSTVAEYHLPCIVCRLP